MNILFSLNGLTSADFYECREWTDLNFPIHCHYTVEAVFVLSGAVDIEKENRTYTLFQNDVMVIMPFEKHKFTTGHSSKVFTFQLSPNLISNYDSIFKNKSIRIPYRRFPETELETIYRRLQNTSLTVIDLNYAFFALVSALLQDNELIPFCENDDLFRKTILYTADHFEESITLKDAAKALNVSYVYLSRMFTRKSGICYSDFLNSFRLQKAATLLSNPSVLISEICYSCGFGSLRNFNRVFLKMMDCTPSEFRRKHCGG